jgi:tetratricopeptide (TPR) repeat protein
MQRELNASIGYLELGMYVEALDEMESIQPEEKNSSTVLGIRLDIYRTAQNWKMMEVVASELKRGQSDDPDHWNNLAFSIRRKDSIKAAQTLLLEGLEKFPNEPLCYYNLGCYACQLGDMEDAKKLVGEAIKMDSKFKLLALDDEDLVELWDSFKV